MNDRKMSDREEKIRTVSDRALTHCLSQSFNTTQHNKTSNQTKEQKKTQQHIDSASGDNDKRARANRKTVQYIYTNEHTSFKWLCVSCVLLRCLDIFVATLSLASSLFHI